MWSCTGNLTDSLAVSRYLFAVKSDLQSGISLTRHLKPFQGKQIEGYPNLQCRGFLLAPSCSAHYA
jgi:hypothetical protein